MQSAWMHGTGMHWHALRVARLGAGGAGRSSLRARGCGAWLGIAATRAAAARGAVTARTACMHACTRQHNVRACMTRPPAQGSGCEAMMAACKCIYSQASNGQPHTRHHVSHMLTCNNIVRKRPAAHAPPSPQPHRLRHLLRLGVNHRHDEFGRLRRGDLHGMHQQHVMCMCVSCMHACMDRPLCETPEQPTRLARLVPALQRRQNTCPCCCLLMRDSCVACPAPCTLASPVSASRFGSRRPTPQVYMGQQQHAQRACRAGPRPSALRRPHHQQYPTTLAPFHGRFALCPAPRSSGT